MYLFDLNAHECFLPQKKDAATGKVKAATAEFPQDWQSRYKPRTSSQNAAFQAIISQFEKGNFYDKSNVHLPRQASGVRFTIR